MRLVDADALKEKTIAHGQKIAYVVSFLWDVDDSPTVDAVPVVHGRWVADSDGLPVCSVCDEVAMQRLHCDTLHGAWRYDVRLVKTPYCPHCGAKMDGERRDEDATD